MVKFGILDKLELHPVPSLPKGKSDEGIWGEIEKELTRAATPPEQEVLEPISHRKRKAIHIVEYQGKRGAWFTLKPSGRRIFIPLEKIDWRRVTITPGIASTVVRDVLKRDPLTSVFAKEIKVTVPVGAQAKLYPQYMGLALNHVTRNKEHHQNNQKCDCRKNRRRRNLLPSRYKRNGRVAITGGQRKI